jgi:hypothetical protein
MYLCGELKERRLILCCIPRPIFNFFGWFCRERPRGSNCSVCWIIVTFFVLPVAIVVGIVLLAAALVLAVLFVPFFLVAVLPCVLFMRCRQMSKREPVRKVFENGDTETGKGAKAATPGPKGDSPERASLIGEHAGDADNSNVRGEKEVNVDEEAEEEEDLEAADDGGLARAVSRMGVNDSPPSTVMPLRRPSKTNGDLSGHLKPDVPSHNAVSRV